MYIYIYVSSAPQIVMVEDVSPPVFQLLLDHLYTDAADVDADAALELLAAADRFGVERLKQVYIYGHLDIYVCMHAGLQICIYFLMTG